jgi:Kef-type K+ transport system membrane component KefB
MVIFSLAAVAAVLLFSWSCGRLVRGLRQPPVIGELAAGILLGPSVFGAIAPTLAAQIFTPDVKAAVGFLSQAAVLVFMFLVGLELDTGILRRHAAGVVRIAAINLVLPFSIGVALAVQLYPSMHGEIDNRAAFILFVGTALAITALPVLTRILTDWRMLKTTIGTIATGCAAIDDIVAWTLLGLVTGLVKGHSNALTLIGLSATYVLVMIGVVRPLLDRLASARERGRSSAAGRVVWVLAVAATAAASCVAANAIGIHAVFGAFVAGACVPRRHEVLEGLEKPLRQVSVVLLPALFVIVGLRTQVGLLGNGANWLTLGLIILCATVGKMGGGSIAARTLGFSWRDSLAIGALLNTRGLVALVALDLGRSLGIISPELFTICVLMTFVTTFMTVPILRALGLRPMPSLIHASNALPSKVHP